MSNAGRNLIRHNAPDGRSWYDLGYYKSETLGRRIEKAMPLHGALPLVVLSETRPHTTTLEVTWNEAKSVASAFLSLGLQPGDRIAMQLPNWYECPICYLACLHAGFIIVPLVTNLGPADVAYIMQNCGARTLVCPAKFREKSFDQIISKVRDENIADHVIIVGADTPISGAQTWEDFTSNASTPAPAGPNQPDDIAFLLYTSGTTSAPKGARHSHNTLGAEFLIGTSKSHENPSQLHVMPPGHTAGALSTLRPFLSGEAVYMMDVWDPSVAVETIAKYGLTISTGTPYHMTLMVEAAKSKNLDLSSMKNFTLGATNVTPAVVQAGLDCGIISTRCYGSTEHPTISYAHRDDPPQKRAFTDGRLLAGSSVRIVDEDGNDLPQGEEGEILSNGPELFLGYLDESLNAQTFVDGIWYRTGDIGQIDEDGYLSITDRKKDIVIRGGENISSREVEEALIQHPAIRDVAVVPCPDPVLGERVCAFIVLESGARFGSSDALEHFMNLGIAKLKTPERLKFIDELPRTPIGKVRKQDLKAILKNQRATQ